MDGPSGRRLPDDAGLALLAVAVAAVVWWRIGDWAEPSLDPSCEDRFLTPPGVDPAAVGWPGVVVGLVALGLLLRPGSVLRQGGTRVIASGLVLAAAVVAAGAYRVTTARGCGAPIGQSMAVPVAVLVVAALAGPGVYLWVRRITRPST